MKALAAVSIRQYERAVESLDDYYRTVELGLRVALRDMPQPPVTRTASRPLGAIVFGSDHGLCGRFNEDVAVRARVRLEQLQQGTSLRLIAVGARAGAILQGGGFTIEETLLVPGSADRITITVRQVLLKIEEWRSDHEIERVYLFHNHPVKGGTARPMTVQMLPVDLENFQRNKEFWPGRSLPIFSMERSKLLAALVRQYFFVSLFRACAQSLAAENTSRLAAMQAAEKSLSEKKEELVGEFRRRRQDAITAELLDVVAGYEATRSPASANNV